MIESLYPVGMTILLMEAEDEMVDVTVVGRREHPMVFTTVEEIVESFVTEPRVLVAGETK